jgi:hypothetical protein
MDETKKAPTEREEEAELGNAELEAVAGGAPRDPQSGLPTGQRT